MIKKPEAIESTLLCRDSERRIVFQLDFELMRRNFGAIWMSFLKSRLTVDLYKRVLVMLHDKVGTKPFSTFYCSNIAPRACIWGLRFCSGVQKVIFKDALK